MLLLEGIVMCFVLLAVCVVGIANGPVGLVSFYEPEVQERVVELGLTTRERIRRNATLAASRCSSPRSCWCRTGSLRQSSSSDGC